MARKSGAGSARLRAELPTVDIRRLDAHRLIEGRTITGEWDGPDIEDVTVSGCRFLRLRIVAGRIGGLVVTDAELDGCDLAGVELSDSRLERLTIRDSRLAGTIAPGCFWRDITVSDALAARMSVRFGTLRRVRFQQCDLSGLDLTDATLQEVRFEDCRLPGAKLTGLTAEDVSFARCDLSAATGAESLRGTVVDGSTLLTLSAALATALGIRLVE